MVKWYSRLLAGIFIPFYLIYMQTIKQKHLCYKSYKKMTLLCAQVNKKET